MTFRPSDRQTISRGFKCPKCGWNMILFIVQVCTMSGTVSEKAADQQCTCLSTTLVYGDGLKPLVSTHFFTLQQNLVLR